jgi:hypothetical protein
LLATTLALPDDEVEKLDAETKFLVRSPLHSLETGSVALFVGDFWDISGFREALS